MHLEVSGRDAFLGVDLQRTEDGVLAVVSYHWSCWEGKLSADDGLDGFRVVIADKGQMAVDHAEEHNPACPNIHR